jgi:hypothetical protein
VTARPPRASEPIRALAGGTAGAANQNRESAVGVTGESSVHIVQTEKNQADKSQSEPLIQRNRSVRILAKSIFRELKTQGYDDRQIVALATELLSEVTDDMSRESARPRPVGRRTNSRAD